MIIKKIATHLGWKMMGIPQHWPYRGWRIKAYRLGAKICNWGMR